MGELAPLTADLPAQYAASPVRRPTAQPPASRSGGPSEAVRWAPATGMLGVFLLNVLIWGIVSVTSGDLVYFWPAWLAIPLVLALIGSISSGGRGHRR
jgi:hypothetical protein